MGLWFAAPKTATARHWLPKEDMNMWKTICVHLHAVLPTGAFTQEQPQSTSSHPEATTERTTSTASTQHLKTLELNTNRKIPHDFRSPDLLQAIDEQSARSWPKTFAPMVTACKLCDHKLGEEVTHPGSEGQQSWTKSVKNFALSYSQETHPANLA